MYGERYVNMRGTLALRLRRNGTKLENTSLSTDASQDPAAEIFLAANPQISIVGAVTGLETVLDSFSVWCNDVALELFRVVYARYSGFRLPW